MPKNLLPLLALCLFVSTVCAQTSQTTTATDDYNTIFKAVKWRSIGPFRGGRAVAACGVVGDPKTYYMAILRRFERMPLFRTEQGCGVASSYKHCTPPE